MLGIIAQKIRKKKKHCQEAKIFANFSLNITPTPNYSHGSISRQNFKTLTTSKGTYCKLLLIGYLCEREETGNE